MPLSSLLSWSPCPSSSILFRGDVCLCDTNSYQRRRKRHRSSVLVKRCKRTGTAVYWMRLPERQREAGYVLLSTSLGPLLSLFSAKIVAKRQAKFLEVYTIATILPVLHFSDVSVPFFFGVWFLSCLCPLNQFPEKMSSLGIVHWFHCVPRTNSEVNKYRFTSQLSNPSFSSYVWYVLKSNILDTRS